MAPFVLKFKGNKSFSPFSNLADGDALAKTWKVCTKVAAHLEQGQRLENISWRLWHLQNLMVDNDNAKSRREFKKLSKHMGERLDKDKGRSIEELEVPDFKPDGTSIGKIKRRAEEKEQRGRTGMKGMTFTFPVDPATNSTPGATAPVTIKKQPLPLHPKSAHHAGGDLTGEDALRAGGLTIDTQLGGGAGGENAPTPTGSSVPVNRTHYRGHHDSISSVSSDIYNTSQFTAPSPPTSNTSSGGGGINGVALQGQSQQSQSQHQHHQHQHQPGVIRFPNIFDDGFGPTALLCPAPTVKPNCSYGEAIGFAGLRSSTNHADVFSIQRPTFEFPLDELMNGDGSDAGSTTGYDSTSNLTNSVSSLSIPTPVSASMASFRELQITNVFGPGSDAMQGVQSTGLAMTKELSGHHQPIVVDADLDGDELIRKSPPLIPSQSAPASPAVFPAANSNGTTNSGNNNNATSGYPFPAASSPTDSFQIPPPLTLPKGANLPGPSPTPTPAPASSSSSGAPHRLPRRYSTTNAPPHTSSSASSDATTTGGSGKKGRHGPSATATAPRTIRSSYGNSAPGGVKSECANCGANSTPLWRRGLNDELNCNACGLFAKLHKRPRPKSLRNSNGEGGSRNPGWASSRNGDETVSCYNCGTVATPLWRKDEDGRTLCNALKLHGEKRPSSMKSDVIRKRSRTDARRGTSSSATPSASPGASRRTSPTPPMVTQPADNGNFSQAHNGQQQPVDHQSPYGQASGASYDAFGNANGSQGQDNSPVDLMSMSHSMVSDAGVDPSASALGGMTFSPGLTYTETLHYPGPLSLSYYQAQYGMPPELTVPPDPAAQGQANVQHGPQQQQPGQSPSLQGVGSPQGAGGMFAGQPGMGGGEAATPSVWDAQFQLPFTSNYSFGFGASMAAAGGDGSNNNPGNNNFGENAGLGVVHPPMLPTWYSSTTGAEAGATKTEPDHEISFGHH